MTKSLDIIMFLIAMKVLLYRILFVFYCQVLQCASVSENIRNKMVGRLVLFYRILFVFYCQVLGIREPQRSSIDKTNGKNAP